MTLYNLGKGLTLIGVVTGVYRRPTAPVIPPADDPPYCIWCGATPYSPRGAFLQRVGEGWNFECRHCKARITRHVRDIQARRT